MATLPTSQDDVLSTWLATMASEASAGPDAGISEDDILNDLEIRAGVRSGSPLRRARMAGPRRESARKTTGRSVRRPPVSDEEGAAVMLFLASVLGLRGGAGKGSG